MHGYPNPRTPKKNGLLVRQEAADKSKQQANTGLVVLCSGKVTVGLAVLMQHLAGLGGGAQGRNRTTDTVIFSHVLYQLSYLGTVGRSTRGRNTK